MCARTRTTYGCGDEIITMAECDLPHCNEVDRFLIEKAGDCKECKSGGSTITRGREGKGRHGRELQQKSSSPQSRSSPDEIAPWAPTTGREKAWRSPTRKQADDAWLDEHKARMTDLEQRTKKQLRVSDPPTRRTQFSGHRQGSKSDDRLPIVYRYESDDDRPSRPYRTVVRRVQAPEYDAHESNPSNSFRSTSPRESSKRDCRTTPRTRAIPISRKYELTNNDSGYGSFRTEPISYSRPVEARTGRHVYEVPASGGVYDITNYRPTKQSSGYGRAVRGY